MDASERLKKFRIKIQFLMKEIIYAFRKQGILFLTGKTPYS